MTTNSPKIKSVTLMVVWGYEPHSITIRARNWSKIQRGQEVRLRGKSYFYEGVRFSCRWYFNQKGRADTLVVGYGNDGAEGYVGSWQSVKTEVTYQKPQKKRDPFLPKAFANINEAKAAFPTPETFRIALVDDVHFDTERFSDLEPMELLRACGVDVGNKDQFCISQVPTDYAAYRRGDESGWGFRYTYRIAGKGRRTVRFQTEHGDGGVCESCEGPYIYTRSK